MPAPIPWAVPVTTAVFPARPAFTGPVQIGRGGPVTGERLPSGERALLDAPSPPCLSSLPDWPTLAVGALPKRLSW